MSDQPEAEIITADDLEPFEGNRRRCPACAWPVMLSEYQPEKRIAVDGEGGSSLVAVTHLLRKCEQCGCTVHEALAPSGVNELGDEITGA